jgi:hypothetical protein
VRDIHLYLNRPAGKEGADLEGFKRDSQRIAVMLASLPRSIDLSACQP